MVPPTKPIWLTFNVLGHGGRGGVGRCAGGEADDDDGDDVYMWISLIYVNFCKGVLRTPRKRSMIVMDDESAGHQSIHVHCFTSEALFREKSEDAKVQLFCLHKLKNSQLIVFV